MMHDSDRTGDSSIDRQRARLSRALSEAAEEWQRSWVFRLRVALGGARVSMAVPVIGVCAIAAIMVIQRAETSRLVSSPRDPLRFQPLPIASLTPGGVTATTASELCRGIEPLRQVAASVRAEVLRDYHMERVPDSAYELDALITPELGGSTDRRNLWPQRYDSPIWNARVKDEVERLLPQLVCDGQVELARAQQDIARDWVAAYKKYFHTDLPLRAHVSGPAPADDDELEIVPVVDRQAHPAPLVARAVFFKRQGW